jgi:indolepyruvate ferredoxin oxidoreductase beta subunit
MKNATGPIRICIAALGGEGGSVLTGWLVALARAEGWPVQSTSIPGVAQRTGATTYYLEVLPRRLDGAASPVFALTPTPGFVDVVVATELLEAGRAVENGLVRRTGRR